MSHEELHSILNDNIKCALFDWYLGTIQKTALLKFWIEVRDYKQAYYNESVEWKFDMVQAIFQRYLRKGSKNFIHFIPNKVIEEIEKKLHNPSADLFDVAQEITFNQMKNKLLVDFLNSELYKNYLGNNTVEKLSLLESEKKRKVISSLSLSFKFSMSVFIRNTVERENTKT
jgi:hypothetical protein